MKSYNNIFWRTGPFERCIQFFFTIIIGIFIFSSCDDQRLKTVRWTEYQPVYMSEQEFMNAVALEEPRELQDPGKIYLYDTYLFINERNKGVHIFDNSDPANPSQIGFINIPANKDIAIKDDLLYADSNSDLLVFNIEDLQNVELISRTKEVFTNASNMPPGYPYESVDASKGVVVNWKKVEVEKECTNDCGRYQGPVVFDGGFNLAEGSTGGTGIAGSTARFAITGDYLYAIDIHNLLSFNISSPAPVKVNKMEVGWNIETIFPYRQNIFIGSRSAMYIYDVSTAGLPVQLSIYPHLTACDPVVVEGKFAYVTLRNSAQCQQGMNRLEVIDVKNLENPQKVNSYEMINPHGLGIDDGQLFIGEGEQGLRILDATEPLNIKPLRFIDDIAATDVIPYNDVLIVTGPGGIVQYNYSNISNLELLSTIPVKEND